MHRRLSAGPHPLVVYLFAAVWIVGFGVGTYQMWFHREDVVFNGVQGAATLSDQLFFLLMWVAGTIALLVAALAVRRLRRVRLTEGGLRVSHIRGIFVPLDAIRRVSREWWFMVPLVSLHLDRTTPLGDCITFIPGAAHVADEIEALAGKARAGTSALSKPEDR